MMLWVATVLAEAPRYVPPVFSAEDGGMRGAVETTVSMLTPVTAFWALLVVWVIAAVVRSWGEASALFVERVLLLAVVAMLGAVVFR